MATKHAHKLGLVKLLVGSLPNLVAFKIPIKKKRKYFYIWFYSKKI